jgi:PAS domain S-box-containing protein
MTIDRKKTKSQLLEELSELCTQIAVLEETNLKHEITEAKASQLAAIVESSDDAIITKTLDGIILSWNRSAERIYGYTADEIMGRHVSMLAPPDRLSEIDAILLRLKSGEHVHHFETERVRKNGAHIYVALTVSPLVDHHGTIIGASTIARDVTEHKRAELALRQFADEIQDLYNKAPCGYHSLDSDGVYVRVNDTELNWLGYTREEVVRRKKFSEVLTPAGNEIFEREFALLKDTSVGKELEVELVTKSGTLRSVSLNATVIKDEEGNFVMSRTIVHDMTERRRADQEKERLIVELKSALSKVKTLTGLLPICASCKKIRSDKGYWEHIETYIKEHSEADFSHGICPDCTRKLYPEYFNRHKDRFTST